MIWAALPPGDGTAEEYAIACDRGRERRLLIIPALFDESNRLRRFTVDVMRRLDRAGIDSFLPDLPGCNESRKPLPTQDIATWRAAAAAAARHFGASHILGLRGGGLLVPGGLPGWRYAAVKGASILRQMLRARLIASREAGKSETSEALLEAGSRDGIELAGYSLGAALVRGLQDAVPAASSRIHEVPQERLGGAGLWMRAEPGESPEQADALAAIIAAGTDR